MFDDEDEDDDDDDDGGSWHSFIEVYETSVTIEKLAHLDGTTLRTGMKIGMGGLEANLIQDVGDPFNGAKKGEMDYSGFTGNEGVSAKHWYRKTLCDFTGMPIWTFANRLSFQVAVIVSNDSIDEFLIQGITKSGTQSLLPQYLSKVDDPATAESGWKMVKHLAELSWSSSHGVSAGSYYSSYEVPRLGLEVMCASTDVVQSSPGFFRNAYPQTQGPVDSRCETRWCNLQGMSQGLVGARGRSASRD